MGLFEMTQDERRAYVAQRLDCNPFTPEHWPIDVIDRILKNVEYAAEQQIGICCALRSLFQRPPGPGH